MKRPKPFQKRPLSTKVRVIDNPQQPLKKHQKTIYRNLLSSVALPAHMMGGISGKNIAANVMLHQGAPVLVTIDIRSFFPSISHNHVYRVWRELMGCSPRISKILTKLTTYRGKLPQGSPTSTMLANLVLSFVDTGIRAECANQGVTYSSWVDDLAFSGLNARMIIPVVISALHEAGFAVSHRKLKVMGRGTARLLHNLVISRAARVSQSYLSDTRSGIHKLSCGLVSAQRQDRYVKALRGRIFYIAALRPDLGERLTSQLAEALRTANW